MALLASETNLLGKPPQINSYGPVTSSPGEDHTSGDGGKSFLLHRSLIQDPLEVVTAKDSILTLASGKEIIDACGGAAVSCLGHGNKEVSTKTLYYFTHLSKFSLVLCPGFCFRGVLTSIESSSHAMLLTPPRSSKQPSTKCVPSHTSTR